MQPDCQAGILESFKASSVRGLCRSRLLVMTSFLLSGPLMCFILPGFL